MVRNISDQPVCALKVASQPFLIAQSLLYEEETHSCFNDFIFWETRAEARDYVLAERHNVPSNVSGGRSVCLVDIR